MLSFLTSLLTLTSLLQGPGAAPARPVPGQPPAKPVPAAPIVWSAARPLILADFLAPPAPGTRWAAMTAADIKAGAACRDFVFTGTVQATFDPNNSWVREPKKASAALLRHEQLHFDLTEVYARRLRQKLLLFQSRVACNKLQVSFNSLTKGVYAEWAREENRYDQETNFGLNAVRQAYWEQQTKIRLDQLEVFAEKTAVPEAK